MRPPHIEQGLVRDPGQVAALLLVLPISRAPSFISQLLRYADDAERADVNFPHAFDEESEVIGIDFDGF